MQKGSILYNRHVQKSGGHTPVPAKLPGYGGKSGTEQAGQQNTRSHNGYLHQQKLRQHRSRHHRHDVPGMLAESPKACHTQNAAHQRTVEPYPQGHEEQEIAESNRPCQRHVHKAGPQLIHQDKIRHRAPRVAQDGTVIPPAPTSQADACHQKAAQNNRHHDTQQYMALPAPGAPDLKLHTHAFEDTGHP